MIKFAKLHDCLSHKSFKVKFGNKISKHVMITVITATKTLHALLANILQSDSLRP